MFKGHPQPWTPLNGGDLGSPANTWGNDFLQAQDESSLWYPKASPTYEAVSKDDDYEMTTIASPSALPTTRASGIEGDSTGLLSAKRQDTYWRRQGTRWRRMRRKFSGWRVGLMMSSSCTGTVFLLNVILTIWAIRTYGTQNGYATLVQGECSKTRKASTWIHLVINVLSTLLLSASNYCMQILTAPTRPEVDCAHAQGRWLDIGVPSVRNLKWISVRRVCIWICLGLSSLPLHLLYNSAVYDTLTANEYKVYGASDQISSWSTNLTSAAVADSFVQLAQSNQLENLTAKACVQAYGRAFVSDRKDLALILGKSNASIVWLRDSVPLTQPYDWICSDEKYTQNGEIPCNPNAVLADIDNWDYNTLSVGGSVVPNNPIEYCLSQTVPEHCQLQFSIKIMIVVIVANFLKLFCMLYTVWSHKIPTLVTVGDAISSFLQDPDPTTVDRCTLSKKCVEVDQKWFKTVLVNYNITYQSVPPQPQPWNGERFRWMKAASKTRWGVCYVCCIITLIIAGILETIGKAGVGNAGNPTDIKSLWNLGFGAVTPLSLLQINGNATNSLGLVGNVLLANAAQVVLSFLYLSYNSIFTCQLLSREWTSYTRKRKPLRVTSPVGIQRSTYFLQLPYTYSLPLMAFSGILHWLVSQSIFLARVNTYDEDGNIDPDQAISTCGYSCIAIIFVLIVGSLLITAGFANGFRTYPTGIPLAATCSAAISAACHPPADDTEAAFKEVQYGEVETKKEVRHCTFTSHPVTTPIAGQLYA